MKIKSIYFDVLDSTNAEALKMARLGADEGLCIIARQQTAGRGRNGKTWFSPENAGLYFSVVLRPRLEAKHLTLITLMTGVAVYETLAGIGLKPDIKWVNDILINEKKICGILAETTETENGIAVIVGIGINIKSTNFPPEITDIATSIEQEMSVPPAVAGGDSSETRTVLIGDLIERLASRLNYWYEILHAKGGPAEILREWRRRSTYSSGKSVRVALPGEDITGITDGLEPNGALRVRMPEGNVRIVQAGDVEKLRKT